MNFIFDLINLAAIEKTNLTPVLYWHEWEGNTKMKLIKIFFIFCLIFKKLGREGW